MSKKKAGFGSSREFLRVAHRYVPNICTYQKLAKQWRKGAESLCIRFLGRRPQRYPSNEEDFIWTIRLCEPACSTISMLPKFNFPRFSNYYERFSRIISNSKGFSPRLMQFMCPSFGLFEIETSKFVRNFWNFENPKFRGIASRSNFVPFVAAIIALSGLRS